MYAFLAGGLAGGGAGLLGAASELVDFCSVSGAAEGLFSFGGGSASDSLHDSHTSTSWTPVVGTPTGKKGSGELLCS